MSKVSVKVKWVKEKYSVDIELDEPVEVFKTQLFALTGVPPERQKITAGIKQITDDTDLKTVGLKDKQVLMMIGTADVLAAPVEKPVFVEDLAPEEMQGLISAGIPFGLENLGNTCYMNSTLQVINNAPELVEAVTGLQGARTQFDVQQNLALSTRDLFKSIKTATEPIAPHTFLAQLRAAYPQFDQRGEGGAPMQQDAEECLTQLLYSLSEKVKRPDGKSVVEELFGLELDVEVKCTEGDEPMVVEKEKALKLACHIEGAVAVGDGTNKGGTDLMTQSISKGLEATLEKISPVLGRPAVYTKTSRISKLPKFLLCQFVRFFWKSDTQKKAKILRPVKFPITLDMKDYCTPVCKERIEKFRAKVLKKQEEEKAAARAAKMGTVEEKKDEKMEEEKKEGEAAAAGAAGGEEAAKAE
eukprot:CAMPEP_0181325370 /NCGR_PEP_ID=MMETSP1101-20121128/20883_1 /TAXON_ID=46948 /ORGANISM="Rhodomonas abbreviata, Strain Caron Lab Isolate" /LENGTH=414 /DNA_ID=CAMNT_0023433661 /DNA_START=116 /DNA_END=1357 /DNA_ORIENTATION=-